MKVTESQGIAKWGPWSITKTVLWFTGHDIFVSVKNNCSKFHNRLFVYVCHLLWVNKFTFSRKKCFKTDGSKDLSTSRPPVRVLLQWQRWTQELEVWRVCTTTRRTKFWAEIGRRSSDVRDVSSPTNRLLRGGAKVCNDVLTLRSAIDSRQGERLKIELIENQFTLKILIW